MAWRKSSHSFSNGNCVEVASWRTAPGDLAVLIRDSTDPGGPVLALSPEVWQALVSRVKAGDD